MKLIIEIDPNGQVNLTGPLHDTILVYGMLESAKDALREFKARGQQQRVLPVPALPAILKG